MTDLERELIFTHLGEVRAMLWKMRTVTYGKGNSDTLRKKVKGALDHIHEIYNVISCAQRVEVCQEVRRVQRLAQEEPSAQPQPAQPAPEPAPEPPQPVALVPHVWMEL